MCRGRCRNWSLAPYSRPRGTRSRTPPLLCATAAVRSGETARCAGTQTRWTRPSDAPGRTRAASDGEGAEKQHAKKTTSSQPLRGTGSPGLHRAPVAEAPAETADTRPWRSPTRHPGLLRTAPGETGLVAELPHREPLRNGSDGAAVTPAVAQPPALPGRQGTQGNPEMLLTTARRQLPAWPVQHQGKISRPGDAVPGTGRRPGSRPEGTTYPHRDSRDRAGHGNGPRGCGRSTSPPPCPDSGAALSKERSTPDTRTT